MLLYQGAGGAFKLTSDGVPLFEEVLLSRDGLSEVLLLITRGGKTGKWLVFCQGIPHSVVDVWDSVKQQQSLCKVFSGESEFRQRVLRYVGVTIMGKPLLENHTHPHDNRVSVVIMGLHHFFRHPCLPSMPLKNIKPVLFSGIPFWKVPIR